jgi:outer membrane protein assembly factor BamE (lipoprotein component of BamABCDE complex)
MRQTIIFAATLTIITHCFPADHTTALRRYRTEKEAEISVGMTPDQVKAKLGAPTAVEAGFPKLDNSQLVVHDNPKLVGQFNNSTWFYFSKEDALRFGDDIIAQTKYLINNIETSKALYETYAGKEILYILGGKIVDPTMGKGYMLTKAPNLQTMAIDTNPAVTCIKPPIEPEGTIIGMTTTTYLEILCVIFDKGTGVVATTRVYYQFISATTKMFNKDEIDKLKK